MLTGTEEDAREDGAGDGGDGRATDVWLSEVQVVAAGWNGARSEGIAWKSRMTQVQLAQVAHKSRKKRPWPTPRQHPLHSSSPDYRQHGRGGKGGEEGEHEGHPGEVEGQVVGAVEAPNLQHLGPGRVGEVVGELGGGVGDRRTAASDSQRPRKRRKMGARRCGWAALGHVACACAGRPSPQQAALSTFQPFQVDSFCPRGLTCSQSQPAR